VNTPARDYRRTQIETPPALHAGLDRWVHRAVGRCRRRFTIRWTLARRATRVLESARALARYSDARLTEQLAGHREGSRRQGRLAPGRVEEALAAVVQAAERALGLTPHPVQVMGALAMNDGFLVEMATG
jgi:preprotein translocase subunit SecA